MSERSDRLRIEILAVLANARGGLTASALFKRIHSRRYRRYLKRHGRRPLMRGWFLGPWSANLYAALIELESKEERIQCRTLFEEAPGGAEYLYLVV